MTAYRLVARVGDGGLEWTDQLLEDLGAATGLPWRRDREREKRETGPSMGAVGEIILTAAVTAVADDAFKALLEQCRTVLDVARKRWHEPPAATLDVESTGEDEAAAGDVGTEG
ncbi:hypothetical protein ABH920_008965 [Catenulispora sp. EB89]|uniref:hypothetical protein n=1 Tax=Catenulispora sp. EB89 TaxID=3156257 RepID=UPI00351212FB